MDALYSQLVQGVYLVLTAKPIYFVLQHSKVFGFIVGVISLIPFPISRVAHIVIMLITVLVIFYVKEHVGLSLDQIIHFDKAYSIVVFVGDYIFGCIGGFIIANTIQRIRGEHDYVNN